MHVLRGTPSSTAKRFVGTAMVILGLVSAIAASAGPGNFVSIYRFSGAWIPGGGSLCWIDIHPFIDGNDAREEADAGQAATGPGTFAGVRPAGQVDDLFPCP